MVRFIQLNAKSFRYRFYVYLDTPSRVLDGIFSRNGISVVHLNEYDNLENNYRIMHVKVLKKNVSKFEECFEDIDNKMLLLGHSDYSDIADRIINSILAST